MMRISSANLTEAIVLSGRVLEAFKMMAVSDTNVLGQDKFDRFEGFFPGFYFDGSENSVGFLFGDKEIADKRVADGDTLGIEHECSTIVLPNPEDGDDTQSFGGKSAVRVVRDKRTGSLVGSTGFDPENGTILIDL